MSVTEQRNTDAASEESLDLSFFDGPKTIARFPPLDPDGPPRTRLLPIIDSTLTQSRL